MNLVYVYNLLSELCSAKPVENKQRIKCLYHQQYEEYIERKYCTVVCQFT